MACPQPFEAQPVASALAGWAAGDSAEATASALVERQVSPACDTVFLSYAKR